MLRQSLLALILALAPIGLHADEQGQALPQGLLDYVRIAKGAGLNDSTIQKNAEQAGWPATAIEKALAAGKTVPGDAPASPAGSPRPRAAEPQQTPPDAAAAKTASQQEAEQRASVDRGVADDYLIGAGDILHINVWKEPDASVASAVVRPDGKISMPLLKEVSVVGLTPALAEQRITRLLAKFINDADVTVVVSGINSKKIYVVGAVKKEGPIAYTYRMSIMQAVSEAGGLTEYAKRKKIYVLRSENGRDFRLPFDYDAALRGERMELNILLLPGDTLVVPH